MFVVNTCKYDNSKTDVEATTQEKQTKRFDEQTKKHDFEMSCLHKQENSIVERNERNIGEETEFYTFRIRWHPSWRPMAGWRELKRV